MYKRMPTRMRITQPNKIPIMMPTMPPMAIAAGSAVLPTAAVCVCNGCVCMHVCVCVCVFVHYYAYEAATTSDYLSCMCYHCYVYMHVYVCVQVFMSTTVSTMPPMSHIWKTRFSWGGRGGFSSPSHNTAVMHRLWLLVFMQIHIHCIPRKTKLSGPSHKTALKQRKQNGLSMSLSYKQTNIRTHTCITYQGKQSFQAPLPKQQ